METLVGLSIMIPAAIVMTLISSFIRAITISILWKWFIVSTFSLPPITALQAFGLSLFISYLFIRREARTEPTQEYFITEIAESLMHPVIVLAIGYIVHLFM